MIEYGMSYCERKGISTSDLTEAQKTLYYIAENMRKEQKISKDGYENFQKALEALERTRWIPVSERLPKEYEIVIASTKYGVYPEAMYSKEYGWEWAYESGADYWEELEEVEAWMPLPESYKESEE